MAKVEKTYLVVKTQYRTNSRYETKGTLAELIQHFSYTLECGASYQHEKGNKKINRKPTTIKGLITALNNAVNNSAANGYAGIGFAAMDIVPETA